jgi:phage shock protein A
MKSTLEQLTLAGYSRIEAVWLAKRAIDLETLGSDAQAAMSVARYEFDRLMDPDTAAPLRYDIVRKLGNALPPYDRLNRAAVARSCTLEALAPELAARKADPPPGSFAWAKEMTVQVEALQASVAELGNGQAAQSQRMRSRDEHLDQLCANVSKLGDGHRNELREIRERLNQHTEQLCGIEGTAEAEKKRAVLLTTEVELIRGRLEPMEAGRQHLWRKCDALERDVLILKAWRRDLEEGKDTLPEQLGHAWGAIGACDKDLAAITQDIAALYRQVGEVREKTQEMSVGVGRGVDSVMLELKRGSNGLRQAVADLGDRVERRFAGLDARVDSQESQLGDLRSRSGPRVSVSFSRPPEQVAEDLSDRLTAREEAMSPYRIGDPRRGGS